MDQFTRCQDCNRGQLTPPDIICLECVNSHHHLLSILDERVASGEITEGEYITECNILRDNHTTAPNMGTHPGPTAWEQSQSVMERMIEAYLMLQKSNASGEDIETEADDYIVRNIIIIIQFFCVCFIS